MRAPSRKHELRRLPIEPPDGVDLTQLAVETQYVGSSEHKRYPSFAGAAKPRADASKCDPKFTDAGEITEWVRAAIAAGQIGGPWENCYPRYAWYEASGVWYEARLVNRGNGDYKGYPLLERERPEGL